MIIRALILFCFLVLGSLPAKAQSLSDFGAWPVLHEGRIKPMESFARANFYHIAGATKAGDLTALEWVAESLFDPSQSLSRAVIKVDHVPLLNLPTRASKRYTLNEVMVAMRPHKDLVLSLQARDPSMLSAPQKSLLSVYQGLVIYNQMIQAFSAVLPMNGADQTYLDNAGESAQRALIQAGGKENNVLKFIPNEDPQNPKISLWEAVLSGSDVPVIHDIKSMARAWNDGKFSAWESTALKVRQDLESQSVNSWSVKLEHYYTLVNPVVFTMILYGFGGLFLIWRPRVGSYMILGGAALHLAALVTRSMILDRPPTGTIYETFLFSAFIMAVFGLIVFLRNKNRAFLGGSIVCAVFILCVSRFFVEGDSMNVLVAVLNTNFWLATHVTCIIIGYAACIIAAMSGHLYLATNGRTAKNMMVPLALVALLFTAIGTLLGGIWADQSWGRFWGWDPKENGALLITLWLAWILHGRISGHFNMRGFACALSLTNIMVAVTWFGVNLLGVGLHSYGFMTGIALGLSAFCAFQCVTVIALYSYHKRKMS